MKKRWLPEFLLLFFSILLILIFAEVAYRYKLYSSRNTRESRPWFYVSSDSIYQYDREFGYSYIPNSRAASVFLAEGYPVSCTAGTVNAVGNRGRLAQFDERAELKILVFGDSFAALAHNGVTWPDLLQDELQQKLSRKVNVISVGRDGYGILQIFDLAAAMTKTLKPDLILITFITDDLARARFWMFAKSINDEDRLFTATDPSEQSSLDPRMSVDTLLLNSQVTKEWCEAMLVTHQSADPLLHEIKTQWERLQKDYTRQVNFLSPTTSFLLNRIMHRDPSWSFSALRTRPRLRLDDTSFAMDEKLRENVKTLDQLKIPYYLIHLPVNQELKAKKYILSGQESSLLESLKQITDKQVINLVGIDTGVGEDTEQLFLSLYDPHPSPRGNAFYARAVADALVERGIKMEFAKNLQLDIPHNSNPDVR